jgi:hypothetical protein
MRRFNDNGRPYELWLGPAADRFMLGLPILARHELLDALEIELDGGPNVSIEVRIKDARDHPGTSADVTSYMATPLSVRAYTAIHRRMTKKEIRRLGEEQQRPTADRGFYVFDILPAEAAFSRSFPQFPS